MPTLHNPGDDPLLRTLDPSFDATLDDTFDDAGDETLDGPAGGGDATLDDGGEAGPHDEGAAGADVANPVVARLLAEAARGELIDTEIEIRSGRAETFAEAVAQQQEVRRRLFSLAARRDVALRRWTSDLRLTGAMGFEGLGGAAGHARRAPQDWKRRSARGAPSDRAKKWISCRQTSPI